jgi:hypothetical protein
MTSPKQRKKGLAILRAREQSEQQVVVEEKPVETPQAVVVESAPASKPKKTKSGLVELKSQDQVVEQLKEEVKTSTGE